MLTVQVGLEVAAAADRVDTVCPQSVTSRVILVMPCAAKNSRARWKNPMVVAAVSSSGASV